MMRFGNKYPTSALLLAASLLILTASVDAATLPWRWSNPAPHGANIVDCAYKDGLAVQVADYGQIFTSTDLAFWSPRDSHTELYLRGVTFLGGRVVISGEQGTILFADDPSEFYLVQLGTSDWLESVAASPDLVVATGDSGAVYTSTNAVTWSRKSTGYNTWLRSVTWGASGFVAVGEDGFIMSSASGSSWTKRTSGTSRHLNRVAWLGDRYWAVGDGGKVLTSTTGSSWTLQIASTTNYLFAAAGSNQVQLIAGENDVRLRESSVWHNQLDETEAKPPPAWSYYSALWDGDSFWLGGETGLWVEGYKTNEANGWVWEVPDDSIRTWLWAAMRTPDYYLVVGDRGTVMASADGIDWDLDLVPDSVTNTVFLGVGGTTNHFFALGNSGAIIHSTNGVTWEALVPRPTTNDLQGFVASSDLFIATGAKGIVLTSSDGEHWARQQTPTTKFLSSAEVFPGGYVTVGDQGAVLTSIDATNWSSHSISTTNWFWRVRYLGGHLLLVGENGTLRTSSNGTNWNTVAAGTDEWLTDATFVNGCWYVVGTGGTTLVSTNLTTWSNLGAPTRKPLFGAASTSTQFLTVGVEGIILRKQLVPDRTPIEFVQYARTDDHNIFLFGGRPDQTFLIERTPDFGAWYPSWELEFTDASGTLLFIEEVEQELPSEAYRGRLLP